MFDFESELQQCIEARKKEGLYRFLPNYHEHIDFCSNDYLGLARNSYPECLNNLPSGGTGSRLISGNSTLAEETEHFIANFHRAEAALLYNAGYMANIGLLACIATKADTFISDEYAHASLIDGMRLSYAKRMIFLHNNLVDLEGKLREASGRKFVVIESIYSMDGDAAPIKEIIDICEKYNALLIVDEAHSTGIYGEKGEGLVCALGLEERVFARIHTFGKAMGLHGAAILGSDVLKKYLINFSRSFIYTTAMPPSFYAQLRAAYHAIKQADREKLFENIAYFKSKIHQNHHLHLIKSDSPIQAIVIGDIEKAKNLSQQLLNQGIFAKAILSPTVAKGTERLRICLHTFNTKAEIEALTDICVLIGRDLSIRK
jgi:8-amino-7-oxononanoate synthase